MRATALFCALLAAPPSLAQQTSVEFRANGQRFTVDVPQAYCTEGPRIAAYLEEQRKQIPGNVPEVVMIRCDGGEAGTVDLITVTWRSRYGSSVKREKVFGELRQTFPARAGGSSGATVTPAELERRFRVHVKTGDGIEALGVDDLCAYVGGTIRVDIEGNEHRPLLGIGCLTVTGGLAFNVLHYRSDTTPEGVGAAVVVPSRTAGTIRVAQ